LSKYDPNNDLDLRVAIFRHTSGYDRGKSGNRLVLQNVHTQKELLEYIKLKGEEELKKLGGAQVVVDCTNDL
jgi:hypothetical protein